MLFGQRSDCFIGSSQTAVHHVYLLQVEINLFSNVKMQQMSSADDISAACSAGS